MLRFILRRLLASVPVFLGISILTFGILHLAPGEPAGIGMDLNAKAADISKQLRAEYGLDRPLHVQYLDWMRRLVTLDFGPSMSMDRRPVIDKIAEALPITLLLNGLEIFLMFGIAVPLGVISALKPGGRLDRGITALSLLLYAAPEFWIALLLMLLLSVQLGWLPLSGLGNAWFDPTLSWPERLIATTPYLVIPMITMASGSVARLSRYVRASMVDVLQSDYLRTARAKGLPWRLRMTRHALRNGMMPLITLLGLMLPGLIGGSVILESVFAIPGMGRLFWGAVMQRDYTLLMAILSLASILTLAGAILADILYAAVDPRIRERFTQQS